MASVTMVLPVTSSNTNNSLSKLISLEKVCDIVNNSDDELMSINVGPNNNITTEKSDHTMDSDDSETTSIVKENKNICDRIPTPENCDQSESSSRRTPDEHQSPLTTNSKNSIMTSYDDREENGNDEYFKPLKRLKMLQREEVLKKVLDSPPPPVPSVVIIPNQQMAKLKSFSISDILNHSVSSSSVVTGSAASSKNHLQLSKIVRPWDPDDRKPTSSSTLFPNLSSSMSLKSPKSRDLMTIADDKLDLDDHTISEFDDEMSVCSEDSSPRSGSSDLAYKSKGDDNPLDALFQMTSKTFNNLHSEANSGVHSNQSNYNGKYGHKKKRKSRTAFTNHQIFGLEKRFLYQKYLSPADRDEIALALGLSNAQVITWFQNRRAKLKRDMEELKKEAHSATLLGDHSAFIKTIAHMGLLKTKTNDLFLKK